MPVSERIESILCQAAEIGRECGARRLVLYGSRARGDFKKSSDIDLAVWDMPERNRGTFWTRLEELPTLLKFDICHITPVTDKEFLENIEKDGRILYEKD